MSTVDSIQLFSAARTACTPRISMRESPDSREL